MFNLQTVLFAFVLLALLLLAGRFLKQKVQVFQKLYLPASVVAGVLALLLGPEVLGAIATARGGNVGFLAGGLFSENIRAVWSQAPGVFINIVFAALFLGETIPPPQDIWRKAAPQVVFGQTLAWGQYVVGILATLLVLGPLFGAHPISATLIEIGFEGGHGTAGGMADTLKELGYTDGADLAIGLATVGIVSGIVLGTALADWGRRKGHVTAVNHHVTEPEEIPDLNVITETPEVRRHRARLLRNLLIDPLSINFAIVGMAIAIGWLILEALRWVESMTWGGEDGFAIFQFVPLFPVALIGGIITQSLLNRLGLGVLVIRSMVQNIAGVALDVVVVAAIASISLKVIGGNLAVFLILSGAGILWNVLIFLWWAPRIFPSYWFEKGIGDMGQSMGVTATGILLLRMVDPDNRTGAFEGFAYKQLFFEPIVGGGLFTAAAPVLISRFGLLPILALTAGLLLFWLILGYALIRTFREPKSSH
ncbi:sodium:glutamate symporter [Candidatus Synechococcus calcipolaris G9]|uniref:Sodium:glutamate symporter n=1 Tax=Candidatus Synechococcus calcipolaris G9 TaxID=1497997 RepID=A0ABT6EYQ7_9SYNE|nr:sodium/glutamate symporter [Candidatus Synechococcus calcipolaris]MDG2990694.1 sodium:glutamate symporter [Candidatus Synechococcus calcipolaris G9]